VPYPLASATTYHRARPSTNSGAVYTRQSPPTQCGAPGGSTWIYIKSADSVTKQGNIWTRREEWRGILASSAEANLYI